jgi:hypothetical protein
VIQATAFVAVFFAALFSQTMSLAGLVLVSTVLQATAVFNVPIGDAGGKGVAAYGVSPYMLMAVVAGLVWLFRSVLDRGIYLPKQIRWPFGLLASYAVVSCIGAFVLPKLFDGLPVNLLLEMDGIIRLDPLHASMSNSVQAFNLCVHGVVLFFMMQASQRADGLRGIASGAAGALILVLCIGFYEQAAQLIGVSSLVPYLANNMGYSQAPAAETWIWFRIGLPFTEPSYASAYLAATSIGLWGVALLGRGWWWAWVGATLSTIGLLNTLGATGLAAAGGAALVFVCGVIFNALRPHADLSIRLRAGVMCFLLILASTWGAKVYQESIYKLRVDDMFSGLIVGKAKLKDGVRELSNKRALEIVKETYGLGVGLGSNRASSFFASLVSNTGVLGAALFCAMLVSLLWRYVRAPALTDMQIFVAVALPTATLAMGLGIPDLNLPMYWGFIFLAFVFCPGDAAKVTTKT